jgi:hypothetical protein
MLSRGESMGHPVHGPVIPSRAARGRFGTGASVVHAFGELLKANGGGTERSGAVAAHLGHDLFVEEADEAMEFFLGALGGFLQALV